MGKIWEAPLCAAVSADDPGFIELKNSVSPGHFLPRDILPPAKTVICFFIPFTQGVIRSNAAVKTSYDVSAGEGFSLASEEWALAYILTNRLIGRIGEVLEDFLGIRGFRVGKIPATGNFDETRLISDWSHRHIARIAALGSFGMNNMLITDKGCCGRFGSLVTDWENAAGKMPYPDRKSDPRRERCLYKLGKPCLACQKRCPAGAYGHESPPAEPRPDSPAEPDFDRRRCYAMCLKNAERFKNLGLADVCGKCLVMLPCSTEDPSLAGI
jgi:epoxyqueuosine reductase QueG